MKEEKCAIHQVLSAKSIGGKKHQILEHGFGRKAGGEVEQSLLAAKNL